jgi:hypothetical protein
LDAGNSLKEFNPSHQQTAEDLSRVTIECTRLSLEKWRLEEGWILCRVDG